MRINIITLIRIRRRLLMLICICLIAFVNLQCNRGTDQSSAGESKVTALYILDERIFFQDYAGMEATYLMFLPLVELEGDEYGEVQPVLAERWEHTDDYTKWTFFLRRDVRWHDGVQFTAHDIKFTMDLRKHPDVIGGKPGLYSVEVLDDFTLTVTYKKPTDGLNTYDVYYPKHLLEKLDPKKFFNWEFWTKPVGNGPYRFVRNVPKTMVEVEANPDYYRGKPRIEKVILKFSQQASLTELLSGNVDAIRGTGDMVLKLKGDDRFRSYHWWGNKSDAIYWNHRNPLFRSAKTRRALTMAINRRELATVLNYPEGVPIRDTITTRRQFQHGDYPAPLPHNPKEAQKLLEEDGWRDTDRNGVLDRAGNEFRFTAVVGTRPEKTAIYVQDQFRRIGVRMEIQRVDGSILRQRKETGDYEAFIGQFSSDQGRNTRYFRKDSPMGYANPEMIRLLNLAEITIDPDERDKVFRRIMPIFTEDMPVTLLVPIVGITIVHRRIKGLSSPYRIDPVWNMEHLWLEDK